MRPQIQRRNDRKRILRYVMTSDIRDLRRKVHFAELPGKTHRDPSHQTGFGAQPYFDP